MKTTEIKDLYGKYITLLHPQSTLAQLEAMIKMIEEDPGLNKDDLPAAYWLDLRDKIQTVLKKEK
jgi:hypothetical protein